MKTGRELAARGVAFIAANTRMHDLGTVAAGVQEGKRGSAAEHTGVGTASKRVTLPRGSALPTTEDSRTSSNGVGPGAPESDVETLAGRPQSRRHRHDQERRPHVQRRRSAGRRNHRKVGPCPCATGGRERTCAEAGLVPSSSPRFQQRLPPDDHAQIRRRTNHAVLHDYGEVTEIVVRGGGGRVL